MMNVTLLSIDQQNDFTNPNGSLHVKGARGNCERTARLIERLTKRRALTNIITTMDSHRKIDISHPMFVVDANGKHPAPYTVITSQDVIAGRWRTTMPSWNARFLAYLQKLEASGRYPHRIWPEHCIIGKEGHNLEASAFRPQPPVHLSPA